MLPKLRSISIWRHTLDHAGLIKPCPVWEFQSTQHTVCVTYNTNQRQCKTEQEITLAKSLRNQHRMDFGQARRTIEDIKQTAITFPADNVFLQIDGMDNAKVSYCNSICLNIEICLLCLVIFAALPWKLEAACWNRETSVQDQWVYYHQWIVWRESEEFVLH